MLIVGKILLALLCALAVILLLVLFFPVSYRIFFSREAEDIAIDIRGAWLLGLLRFCYIYPKNGDLRVKLAFITIYRSSREQEKKEKKAAKAARRKKSGKKEEPESAAGISTKESEEGYARGTSGQGGVADGAQTEGAQETGQGWTDRFREAQSKAEKISDTFHNICDKMKNAMEDASYYKSLLEQKEMQGLLQYTGMRAGKILGHLKPRSLKAELLVGTGSPDTTGYLLAGYGILLPWVGRPENIRLTADFEQAVFEGRIKAKGHITVFRILSNGLLFIFDRRVRRMYRKVKKHNNKRMSVAG